MIGFRGGGSGFATDGAGGRTLGLLGLSPLDGGGGTELVSARAPGFSSAGPAIERGLEGEEGKSVP